MSMRVGKFRVIALVLMGVFMIAGALFLAANDADALDGPRKYKNKNGTVKTNGYGLGPYPIETAYANKFSGSFVMCSPNGFQSTTTNAQGAINKMRDGWIMRIAANRTCANTIANSSGSQPAFQGGWETLQPQTDADGWVPVHIMNESAVNPDTGRYVNGMMYPKTVPEGYVSEDTDLWYNQNTDTFSYWDASQDYYHPGGNYNEVYLFEGSLGAQGLTSEQGYDILNHELGHAEGYAHGTGTPETNPSYYGGYDTSGPTCSTGQPDEAGVCGSTLQSASGARAAGPEDVGSPEGLTTGDAPEGESTSPESTTPSEAKGDPPADNAKAEPKSGDLPPEANEKVQPKGGDAPSEDSLSETPEAA